MQAASTSFLEFLDAKFTRVLHLSYVLGCNPFCTFFNEIRYYLLEKMLFISDFNIQKLCTCRGRKAIAVVYFRAGYTPNDYPSESVSCFALFSYCSKSHSCTEKNLCFSSKMYTFVLF